MQIKIHCFLLRKSSIICLSLSLISNKMDSKLTIYKASAGSGKTYTLTGAFLKLAIKYPDNFRHILAVTFTNKAAEEMKVRILYFRCFE